MRRILFVFPIVISLSLCIFAQSSKIQEKPNFNGVWILDEQSSLTDEEIKNRYKDYKLVIKQTESEIKITRSAIFEGVPLTVDMILYPDNRGENNKSSFVDLKKEIKSKTQFKKHSIIRKYGDEKVSTTEKYSLSEDEKTLILTYKMSPKSSTTIILPSDNARLIFKRKVD